VKDALGRPQSVLLLGGTSEIARAVLGALPQERLERVVLLGRDEAALAGVAQDVRANTPARRVEVHAVDAVDVAAHARVIDQVFDGGDVDVTVLAVGVLGDQARAEADPVHAVEVAQASFVGPLSLLLHVGRRLRVQGHGDVVVLSSVAAVRARRSNFVYGAAKAGLDAAALGLCDALAGTGVRVLVVRPGFVRTRMTAGRPVPPLATDADTVGRAVVRALSATGLRGRSAVVYPSAAVRAVALAVSVIPRPVLRRLPF